METNYSDNWKDWLNGLGVPEEQKNAVSPILVSASITPVEEQNEFDRISDLIVTANAGVISAEVADQIVQSKRLPAINGRPRMLHVSAFMVHEGVNNNRDGFIAEELRRAVEEKKLFQGPYAAMMDVNHDFVPRGYWYASEYVYDEVAQAYGILAHGAIWAWRFADLADMLIADQAREGKILFSMACLSANRQVSAGTDGRPVNWMHDPIFIASTILIDNPPGDSYARGVVQEDPKTTGEEDRRIQVLETASSDNDMEDDSMDITEMKKTLETLLEGTEESVLSKVAELLDQKDAAFTTALSGKEAELSTAAATIDSLKARIAELEGEVNEKSVAFDALKGERETLETRTAELEGQLSAYKDKEETERLEAVKVARLGELSEPARHALDQMPEEKRNSLVARWASLSDEDWTERKIELNLASTKTREISTGRLPVGGKQTESSLDRFLR